MKGIFMNKFILHVPSGHLYFLSFLYLALLVQVGKSIQSQLLKRIKQLNWLSQLLQIQDALKEIEKQYKEKEPNIKLSFNFGASGALQQQIEQGAPADLFFSAAEDKFQTLVKRIH